MSKRARLAALIGATLATIVLGACPLPFEFTPKGLTNSGAGSNDPANPSTTAPPQLVIVESTSGAGVSSDPDPIVAARNIEVSLETETPSAVVFYTTDGSDPLPGNPGTALFSLSSPIVFNDHGEGATIKALAIGPNMYPSLVTTKQVSVSYARVATPTFTPLPGNYSTDYSVTISTATSGASVYYTIVDGLGGAPAPVPGQPGTLPYSGPVVIRGQGTAKSISASAVKSEMLDSSPNSGVFSIRFDQVLLLDGVDDFVSVPLGNHTFNRITLEVWINVPFYGADAHFVSIGQNIGSALGSWSSMQIAAGALGITPETTGDGGPGVLPDSWHHFAYTYDGTNQYLLIDGNVVSTTPTTGTITNDPLAFDFGMKIGARFDSPVQFTVGRLDEIRVWNVHRTQAEIAATMNSTLTGSEAGLVGYWNFDDGTPRDLTGNGADGTLQGGAVIVLE